MNLDAIKLGKTPTQRAADDAAQRSVAHAGNSTLFRRVPEPIRAAIVAKAAATHGVTGSAAPATPAPAAASPAGDIASVLKGITDGFAQAVAAIRSPVTKAPQATPPAPAASPTPAVRSTSNPPSVPMLTETQRNRAAEGREQARKAAAVAEADRVLVTRGGGRVRVLKALDASLSDAAVLALNHITAEFEKAERRPVRVYAADLSRALDLPLEKTQAAYTELSDKKLVIASRDSTGVLRVQPGLTVARS